MPSECLFLYTSDVVLCFTEKNTTIPSRDENFSKIANLMLSSQASNGIKASRFLLHFLSFSVSPNNTKKENKNIKKFQK